MDERLRILKMVEDGTITAEQAAELMKAKMCIRDRMERGYRTHYLERQPLILIKM